MKLITNYKPCIFVIFLCLVALISLSTKALSQDDRNIASNATKDTILNILNLSSKKDSAEINDIIAVKLSSQKSISEFTTLYADGIKIEGLKPWKTSECDKTVFFQLNESLRTILLQVSNNKSSSKSIIGVFFSIGTASSCLAKVKDPIYVEIKQPVNLLGISLIALLIIVLIIAALKYQVLKDDNNLYYSLGRAQLFYWSVIFVFAYLYICFLTGEFPDIPASMLTILGISIGTTAASKLIENNNKDGMVFSPNAKSKGWFLDILSDGSSINIHRFQNVMFNLVFGIIFLQKVIASQIMPAFDNNILILLGLSSGTYAGLKLTEKQKDNGPSSDSTKEDDSSKNTNAPKETVVVDSPTPQIPNTAEEEENKPEEEDNKK